MIGSSPKITISFMTVEILPNPNVKGDGDIYVKAVYGGQPFKSNLIAKGPLGYQINQTTEFTITSDPDINFELWRNNKGAEQLVGTGAVQIMAIKQSPNAPLGINLVHEKNQAATLLILGQIKEAPGSQSSVPNEGKPQYQQQQSNKQGSLNMEDQTKSGDNPSVKKSQARFHSVSLKDYYDQSGLTSVLQKGLEEIGKTRPQDPIQFLGKFLLDNDKSHMGGK